MSWRIPTVRSARADPERFRPAVCPACGHATDDEMLVALTRIPLPARSALQVPVAPAMCTNVCLERWLNAGGELAGLFQALGADAPALSAARQFDERHPGRFVRLARQAPPL